MTDEKLPLALMPVVVNENTCKDWEDCCEGAETVDCVGWLDNAVDGATVPWMTLVTTDPAVFVQTLVKENT